MCGIKDVTQGIETESEVCIGYAALIPLILIWYIDLIYLLGCKLVLGQAGIKYLKIARRLPLLLERSFF